MRYFLYLFFMCAQIIVAGQDVIEFHSGTILEVKDLAKSSNEIKFKLFTDSTDVEMIAYLKDIRSIRYANGKVLEFEKPIIPKTKKLKKEKKKRNEKAPSTQSQEDTVVNQRLRVEKGFLVKRHYFNDLRISKSEFNSILCKNKNAFRMYNSGQVRKVFGVIIGIPAGFLFGLQIGAKLSDKRYRINKKVLRGSLAVGLLSMILEVEGDNKMKKAIRIYNQKKTTSLEYGVTPNGIGLVMRW